MKYKILVRQAEDFSGIVRNVYELYTKKYWFSLFQFRTLFIQRKGESLEEIRNELFAELKRKETKEVDRGTFQ